MRIALLTESADPRAKGVQDGDADWSGRLARSLPEHEFHLYAVPRAGVGDAPDSLQQQVWDVRALTARERRLSGRPPRGRRLRHYLDRYEELVRSLVDPRRSGSFGAALYALAEPAAEDFALPAMLVSRQAQRVLEGVWQSPGADTAAGVPLLRDVLAAADLLEQCLRPLSLPWYGDGDGLGDSDLCHVVGGGAAAIPALVAKQFYGVPFVLTEHGVHVREQQLGYRTKRQPVRALMHSFSRLLAREIYRQAAVVTPGSEHDRRWQEHCGAVPARIRVVREGVPAAECAASGTEPQTPTLVWAAGPDLAPQAAMMRAFARIRAEFPQARLRMHGAESADWLERCRSLARELDLLPSGGEQPVAARPGGAPPTDLCGPAGRALAEANRAADARSAMEGQDSDPAVVLEGGPASAAAYAAASVVVFPALTQSRPGELVQAMLTGRALIATDTGLAREVVGPTGLLVPPGDPEALATACAALLGDAERRTRLGAAGRLRALELFDTETEADAFRMIYLTVVSRWPAPPAGHTGRIAQPFARPAEYWTAEDAELVGPYAETV